MTKKYQLQDLAYLMSRLRDKESGCPWDIDQCWSDIVPHTLEEVYEVIDAIQQQDWPQVEEELGDLLFQIIFYCQLAEEKNWFNIHSVIDQLVTKLIRRHPHVFPNNDLHAINESTLSQSDIAEQWDRIKSEEKNQKVNVTHKGLLTDIPKAMPALQRMQKIQQKVSKTGLDWPDAKPLFNVLRTEIDELEQAFSAGSKEDTSDELGDVFFSLVNLSRKLGIDAETCASASNRKFSNRFNWIERHLAESGVSFNDLSEQELDQYWQRAKRELLKSV